MARRPSSRTLLAVLLVAPWVAWAALRGLGLDRGDPLVRLVAFTPYAAATVPLAVLAAAALRRRAVAAVAATAGVVLVLAVAPRALPGPNPSADGPVVTVMTANLYEGHGDARTLLALVRSEDVDVLSLQELTPHAVAKLDAAGATALLPGRSVAARTGAGGSGLLARRPLRGSVTIDPTGAAQAEAQLDVPGARPLRLVAVHPHPPMSSASEPAWRAALRGLPPPGADGLRILAGDFNGTLDHREMRRLLDAGYHDAADATGQGLRPTWPTRHGLPAPPLTIDHVLVDPRIRVRSVRVRDIPGSDHRAVVAELVLPRRAT